LTCVPAPAEDAIELDELCVRFSPALWLWVAVSRQVGQVLGFGVGDRSDTMLEQTWAAVPLDYRDKPVYTDHWSAYARFFAEGKHHACDKGSGLTSIVEGLNTKWRQRQSGLVRRSCGVHPRIKDDLRERFWLLVDSHNKERARRWNCQRQDEPATQSNP
jgi:IS1 family transposase